MNNYINEKIPLKEKLSYGVGAMAAEFQLTIIGSYLLLFLTDVMQISPIIAGGVFTVGGICDAFTDVWISNIADKTKTKWGKYRPWTLMGIPLAIAFALNFMYPGFLTTNTRKVIWIYVAYLITVPIFQTCFLCPYMTLNNVMSKNSVTRLDFATCRTLGESIADILVNALVMTIVLSFGSSFKDITGWRIMALIFAGLSTIAAIIGFLGTKERITITNKDENGKDLTLLTKIKLYKGNTAAYKMLIITVSFYFFFAFAGFMFSYFCIYNLGHEDWLASLGTIGIIAQLPVVCALPYLGRKFSKRTLIKIGGFILLIAFTIGFFMNNFTTALIYQLLKGIGIGFINSLIWSLWPDVTDYTTEKTGIAAPGIIMAVAMFVNKMGFACSSLLGSWILTLGNYDASLTVQAPKTLMTIRIGFVLIPVICILITMIANHFLTELDSLNHS